MSAGGRPGGAGGDGPSAGTEVVGSPGHVPEPWGCGTAGSGHGGLVSLSGLLQP